MPLLLFALAFGVRVAVGLALVAGGRYEGEVQLVRLARGIAEGHDFFTDSIEGLDPDRTGVPPRLRSFRPPLYPLLLAGLYRVWGPSDLAVVVFQSALSALVPALVFLVGTRLFDSRIALTAAAASAVYPYSVVHDVRPFETPLFEALLGVLVLLLHRLAERPAWGLAAWAGLVLGLAITTRSFMLVFPALIAVWLPLGPALPVRRTVVLTGTILLVAGLALTPWIVRNYRIHRAFVPATTYGGWNFYLGNNELALAAARRGEEVDRHLVRHLNDSGVNLAGLSEVELDRWFYRRGLEFVAAHPGEAALLFARKAWNLWSPFLNPPSPDPVVNLVHVVSYGPILVLGLLGVAGSLCEARRYALLYGLFLYFTVVYSAYLTMSRYRKPLDPYLLLFAANVVVRLYDRAGARRGHTGRGRG